MNALHDAAMAAKRFHDAALAYLDRPESEVAQWVAWFDRESLIMRLQDCPIENPLDRK